MNSFLSFSFLKDPIGEEMELQEMSSKCRGLSSEDILPLIEDQPPRDVSNEEVNPRDKPVLAQSTRPLDAPVEAGSKALPFGKELNFGLFVIIIGIQVVDHESVLGALYKTKLYFSRYLPH